MEKKNIKRENLKKALNLRVRKMSHLIIELKKVGK